MKKTERDGLYFLEQDGPKLGWSEASGVELIEQDGHYFKDLERTGALLPYEDWRLSAKERAKDLASRFEKNFVKYTGNDAGKALVEAGPHA